MSKKERVSLAIEGQASPLSNQGGETKSLQILFTEILKITSRWLAITLIIIGVISLIDIKHVNRDILHILEIVGGIEILGSAFFMANSSDTRSGGGTYVTGIIGGFDEEVLDAIKSSKETYFHGLLLPTIWFGMGFLLLIISSLV